MTKLKGLLIVLISVISISYAFSQENCNNGIDDNGNGLIDCNDPECQFMANIERGCNCDDGIDNDGDGLTDIYDGECAAFYGLTFVSEEDSDCSIEPPDSLNFFDFIDTPGQSQQNTVDTQSKMAIGDLDGDGIPEVVATSKWGKAVRVIASGGDPVYDPGDILDEFGSTGQDDIFPKGNYVYELEVVIADIDGDGQGEVFSYAGNRQTPNKPPDKYYLVGLTYENGQLEPLYDAVYMGDDRPGIMGIADFDGDGLAEIYYKNQIHAAETGTMLAQGSGDWETEVNSAPVAVNILPSTPNLELVSGGIIYNVPDLTNRNPATPINLTVALDINDLGAEFYPKELFDPVEYGLTNYSSTSVADMNGDGHIDVVLSGARGSSTGNTAVYFWDVYNNTYSYFEPPDPNYPGGWPWGTSRPNLGDANGDGQMDILFIAGNQLFALTLDASGNLIPLWPSPRIINDSRSGIVAVTIYDFDNDGNPEVVYRDSQQLVIVDGATGQDVKWATVCQSHTMTEGPIIADVDGDGGTDITVPCYFSQTSFNINGQIQQQALGSLNIFFSSENLWLPTRKVWNQPGYFVVNINDDLTVPEHQMDQGMIFGNDPCGNGIPGPVRPFNIFLNQVPTISADGCPFYPAPDVSFVGDNPNAQPGDPDYKDPSDPSYFPAVNVIPPICGDLGIEVEFNIINDGSLTISSAIPVSFWDGDPTIDPVPAQPATLLYQEDLIVNDFRVGDTIQIRGVVFNSTGKAFRLYIVLNDDGTVLPAGQGSGTITECKLDNNVYYFDIIPDPFEVSIEKIQDNIKCEDSAPDNGELRAVVTRNGVEVLDYSDFAFQWYDDATATNPIPAPAGTSNVLTGLPEGDYSLIVTNTDKGCASIPTDTSIVRIGVDPEITIVENSPQSHCFPPNGELEVFITGGNAGFTFEWFDRFFNPIGITGSVASSLTAGEYIVSVFKDGCTKTGSYTLNGPVIPVVQTSLINDITNCANLSSGKITAEASISGIPQDSSNYTFSWYEWDAIANDIGTILPPVHGTGPTRSDLPAGEYAVIVRDNITGCESDPPIRQIIQDLTVFPTIAMAEVTPQTSCDPTSPNGQIMAEGYINGVLQNASDLTFEWFEGDNTLPSNLITDVDGVNGEIANGIAGGLPYTVRVTTSENCATTLYDTISDATQVPVVTALPFDNNICDPSLALNGVFTGRVEASATFDGLVINDYSDYTFTWFDGEDITDPVLSNTSVDGDILYELDAGRYTVILERNSLSCISVPITVEVFDVTTLPVINVSEVPATNCIDGNPNGELTANVDIGGMPTINGHSFQWFEGTDVTGSGTPVAVTSGVNNETALQLTANSTYTVLVINDTTGCENTLSNIVSDSSDIPVLNLTMTPNSICDPIIAGMAYNGSISGATAYKGAGVADYSDYYFNLYEGNDTTGVPYSTITAAAANFTALDSGFYTMRAYNTALGCYSDPVTIEVLEDFVFPVINLTEQGATNCDPLLPNGELTADVGGVLAGYTFKWVEGTDVDDPQWAPVSGTADETAEALLAGDTYTVKVTTDATGCFSTLSQVVSDSSELPIISLSMTPNSICDPVIAGVAYNGTINGVTTYQGVGVTDYTDYYFDLYEGPDMTGPLHGTVTAAAANFIELDSGFYTMQAVNTALGCYSDPVTIEVLEDFILPVIDLTEQGATNCDPALPNGVLSADVGGVVAGYTFKWVEGPDVNDPQWTPVSGTQNETAEALLAGDTYTVKVTTDATGCFSTLSRIVSDSSDIPVLALSMTPNSICDPAVAMVPYDGTITGVTTYMGAGVTDYSDYYFNLFEGNDTTGILNETVTAAAANFIELDSGFYTMRAYNTALGCYSDPATIEVLENFVFPVISLTEQGATNCDPNLPNGVLTADVGGVVAGYTFKWVEGLNVDDPQWAPVSGTEEETAEALLAGDMYSVKVTTDATGCFSTLSRILSDSSEVPVLSLAQTPNTICDDAIVGAFDGTISGSLTYYGSPVADFTPFDFNLFAGTDTTGAILSFINGADPDFIQLQDGDYTVRAYEDVTGCFSDPVTIEILDNTVLPNILITQEPNSSCDDAQPNGNIQAFVDIIGNTADHNFTWYDGPTVTPGNETATTGGIGEIITLMGNQNYTVEAVSQITGCVNSLSTFLNRIIPTYDLSIVVSDIVDCNNGGSILATVDSSSTGPVADYTNYEFYWYRGDVVNPGSELPETSRNLTEISPGVNLYSEDYTVYAINTYTHCVTNDITGFVAAPAPLFDILSEINFYPSDCETDEGALTAWVDNGGVRDYNYNFYWYEGLNINPGSNFYTDPPVAFTGDSLNVNVADGSLAYIGSRYDPPRNVREGPTIYNLGDGAYSVVVEDWATGCKEYIEIALPSIITPPTLLGTVQGSSLCPYTIGDGIVEAAINPDSLIAQSLDNDDYDFYLYNGISTAPGDLIIGPLVGDPGIFTYTELSNALAPGYYTVVANEKVSGSYCPSVPLTLEIESLALPPVVTLNSALLNNTSCDSTVVNGQIELLVEKDPDDLTGPATYSLTWVSTASTSPPDVAGVVEGVQGPYGGLNFGTYDVTVMDENSTCETTETYVLYNTPPGILVDETTLVVTDKYFCVPSGHIEITNIEVGGNLEPLANFTYEWYDGAGNLASDTPIGAPAITSRLDSITYATVHDGTYYVIVTKDPAAGGDGAGCESAPFNEQILDRTIDPTILISQTANLACDSSFATGAIALEITTGGSIASDYEFTINSTGLAVPINGFTGPGGLYSEINLGPGVYEVTARDVDNECTSTSNRTIEDHPVIPYIEFPDLTILHQMICANDGSISVDSIRVNGLAEIPGSGPGEVNYVFTWYEDQPLGPGLGVNGNLLDTTNYPPMEAGAFYFKALRDNNAPEPGEGCETAPYRVDIEDLSVDPTIMLAQIANQACDLSFATGSLILNVNTGGVISSDYEYTITSTALGGPLNGFTNDDGTPDEWTEINLGPGQYNVEVTDVDNFCINNGVITINDNPSVPYVESVDMTILPQSICANDGNITVDAVRINGNPETPGTNPGEVNYLFTWYEGQVAAPDLGVSGNVLDTSNYASIQAGSYYFTALRDNDANEPGEGCETAPFEAVIDDISEDPVLALSMTANQSCDTSVVANGTITAVITSGLNSLDRFNYTWTAFPTDRPTEFTGGTGSTNEVFNDRSYGLYTLEIEDEDTRCRTARTITVVNNPFTPIIDNTDFLVNDQSVCFNDGSVIVFGIFPGDTSQYDFAWYDGLSNLNSGTSIPGVVDGILDTTAYASIQAGDYYFTATNVDPTLPIGYGCVTAPKLATINDVSVDPQLILIPAANQNCDLSFANGSILANATTSGIPGLSYSYTLTSTVLGTPIDSLFNDAQVFYDSLGPGSYNVYVVDDITQCVSNRNVTVADQPVFIEVTDVNYTVTDQFYCMPDGSIVIDNISENGIPQALTDYAYIWYDGQSSLNTGNPIAGVSDSFLDTTNYATIGAGAYFFTVTKLASAARPGVGCESAPLRADIFDLHTNPNVIFDMITNTSCDPTNPNGEVLAIAFENDGTDTDLYSYLWTYNGAALPAGVVQVDSLNTSRLITAPEGQYELLVTNTSRTQCVVNSATALDIDEYAEVPNIIVVDATDPFFCYPTGALEVTQITVGGLLANVGDFDYEWYQGNFTPGDLILDSLGNPVISPQLSDIYPNTYYVIARNTITQCESIPKEAEVSDANIVYPVIHITQSAPLTSCDPMQPNASLSATVDGGNDDTNPDYQFTWFNSLDGSGPSIGTTSTIFGLGADDYSVSVFNVITGCASIDYYITEDDILNNLPIVSVAASPQTNCVVDDGLVSAEVINYLGNFQYDWYIGDVVGTVPDFTGQIITGLPPGLYTVTATELDTTYCTSEPAVVRVRDERMTPNVLIEEDNPLTNCWVTDPNGQFSATVDGMVGGYTFEWYIGTDTTGMPDHIQATYSGLAAQMYTLVVTDINTNCSVVQSVDLTDNTVTPPTADPEVVQHLQSCVELDGWVRASVGGNIIDYIFDWYDGASVGSSSDWVGVNYRDLDAGFYTVTAQDMITGCVSEGVPVEVLDQREMPMFDFTVINAHCEQVDGSIEIVWENDVPIGSTNWYDTETGQHIETGSAIYNYPPGVYEVVVTTIYGCEEIKEAEIGYEIYEFNGISANGDGRNDFFDIACISEYPNNHVRIFNRAGQLVFEAFGYNNLDVVFTGIGENGMYLAGRELPDGTYFYIIDKGDGTEPVAGYLELIR